MRSTSVLSLDLKVHIPEASRFVTVAIVVIATPATKIRRPPTILMIVTLSTEIPKALAVEVIYVVLNEVLSA
jgi:hypothetical protein